MADVIISKEVRTERIIESFTAADGSITTAKLAANAVTLAKLQQIATNKLLGRSTSGTGDVELIDLTSAGRALIDDADAAAQLTTLGFSAFVKSLIDDANAGTFLTSLGLSAFIQTLLDDADAATARSTLGAAAAANAVLTGTPTAPTATAGTNSTQISTTAFVQTAIANLIASSPSALDTLNELAAALGNDANFATTITNALALKAALASPSFTGTPTAPTAAGGTNTTQIATTAFVAAGFQPLDADLTSIAALPTAAYGRSLLTLADVAALQTTINGNTVIPIGANGKYTTISAALAAITDASITKRYTLVMLENITEAAGVMWKSYISLDLNAFKFEIVSTGSEAAITTPSGVVGVTIRNGEVTRSGGTVANTYCVFADSPAGATGFRLLVVNAQNSCSGTDSHCVVFANGGAGSVVSCIGMANSANVGFGVYCTGTNAAQVIQSNVRGIGAADAATVQVYGGQSLGRNSTYPGVLVRNAARGELAGTRLNISVSIPALITSDNGSINMQSCMVYAAPLRSKTTLTGTGTITTNGLIEAISIDVTVAGSTGATITFGSSAGASDVAAAVAINTVGVKQIVLASPVPITTTLHATITGTGATVTVNVQTAFLSAGTPVQINGVGPVQIDNTTVIAQPDDDAVSIGAAAAAMANIAITSSTLRVLRKSGSTKAAINAASACTLKIDNCVFDAPVALVNVTCAAPTATFGSNIHR